MPGSLRARPEGWPPPTGSRGEARRGLRSPDALEYVRVHLHASRGELAHDARHDSRHGEHAVSCSAPLGDEREDVARDDSRVVPLSELREPDHTGASVRESTELDGDVEGFS